MQLIIVYIILAITVVYTIYAIIKYTRKKNNACDGCSGCEMKDQIAKNLKDKTSKDPSTCNYAPPKTSSQNKKK